MNSASLLQRFRMLMFLAGLCYIVSNGSHRHDPDGQFPRQSRAATGSQAYTRPAYFHHASVDPIEFPR